MIGSFIGRFAIGLLSAHVYCCGQQVGVKMFDAFYDIFRAAEKDAERIRLDPEEKAKIFEWGRRHSLKKKDDDAEPRRRTKSTTKPRPRPKPSAKRWKNQPATSY